MNEVHNRGVVRAEQAAGRLLGDHTWDHSTLTLLTKAGQAREMDRERRTQASITGADPCLFRPPGGSYDTTTLRLAQQRGMQVWNWSVDTEDWKASGSGAAHWVHRIKARAIAGGSQTHPVILMHNQPAGNPATVAALPAIIRYYKTHHYRFVDLHGDTGLPTITRVTAASGSTAGGTRVTLHGTDLRNVHHVWFGNTVATKVSFVSAWTLYAVAPRHAAGPVDVRVSSDHGTSPQSSGDRYRFVAP